MEDEGERIKGGRAFKAGPDHTRIRKPAHATNHRYAARLERRIELTLRQDFSKANGQLRNVGVDPQIAGTEAVPANRSTRSFETI